MVAQFPGNSNAATTYRADARLAPEHLADAAEILGFMELRTANFGSRQVQ